MAEELVLELSESSAALDESSSEEEGITELLADSVREFDDVLLVRCEDDDAETLSVGVVVELVEAEEELSSELSSDSTRLVSWVDPSSVVGRAEEVLLR